ncbi:hypothetical protein KR018_009369, partial [Drosophila ironensis]
TGMLQPRRGLCPKVAWYVLKAVLYTSWILGLFPFSFDARRKQLRRSRRLLCYGVIFNTLLVSLILYFGLIAHKQRNIEGFKRNPVLENINWLIGLMSLISAIVNHVMNCSESQKVQALANEMLNLQYGGNCPKKNCPKFNQLVIQKSLSLVSLMLTLIIVHFGLGGSGKGLMIICLLCLGQLGLNLMVMHCYLGILLVYRHVWLINEELVELAGPTKLNPSAYSTRIRCLVTMYGRLLDLSKGVASAYDVQMTFILISGLAGNIVVTYFFIVYGVSLRQVFSVLIVFPLSLLANIWDFWLSIVACDLTESAGQETARILKLFTDLDYQDIHFERSVNEFSWLCAHRKFHFRLCGMFTVNYKMGFQMTITSFLYLVYLVQFDFMNL